MAVVGTPPSNHYNAKDDPNPGQLQAGDVRSQTADSFKPSYLSYTSSQITRRSGRRISNVYHLKMAVYGHILVRGNLRSGANSKDQGVLHASRKRKEPDSTCRMLKMPTSFCMAIIELPLCCLLTLHRQMNYIRIDGFQTHKLSNRRHVLLFCLAVWI